MKIYFHNPHNFIWYKTPINFWLHGRNSANKYEKLIDHIIEKEKCFNIYIDSFNNAQSILNDIKKIIFKFIYLRLWCGINSIPYSKLNVVFDINKIEKNSFLFLFGFGVFWGDNEELMNKRRVLNKLFINDNVHLIVHFSHYQWSVKEFSSNLKLVNPAILICENDLMKNSPFFKQHFSWFKKTFLTVPFFIKDKFVHKRIFSERLPKCVIFGTLAPPMLDKDFVDFFGTDELHPIRRKCYESKDINKDLIETLIFPAPNRFDKHSHSKEKLKETKMWNIDIVNLYNNYMMFIVPEENGNIPGIGFMEGMICGSVFLGSNKKIYDEYGLIPFKDYILFDGTYNGLITKIEYYLNNIDELKIIQLNSLEKSKSFNSKEVYGYLENRLTDFSRCI